MLGPLVIYKYNWTCESDKFNASARSTVKVAQIVQIGNKPDGTSTASVRVVLKRKAKV